MIDEMQVIVGAAYKHLYRLDKRIKLQESNLEYQKESEKNMEIVGVGKKQ